MVDCTLEHHVEGLKRILSVEYIGNIETLCPEQGPIPKVRHGIHARCTVCRSFIGIYDYGKLRDTCPCRVLGTEWAVLRSFDALRRGGWLKGGSK